MYSSFVCQCSKMAALVSRDLQLKSLLWLLLICDTVPLVFRANRYAMQGLDDYRGCGDLRPVLLRIDSRTVCSVQYTARLFGTIYTCVGLACGAWQGV